MLFWLGMYSYLCVFVLNVTALIVKLLFSHFFVSIASVKSTNYSSLLYRQFRGSLSVLENSHLFDLSFGFGFFFLRLKFAENDKLKIE